MDREYLENLFDLSGKVAAITGGGGVFYGQVLYFTGISHHVVEVIKTGV